MDVNAALNSLLNSLGESLPNILGALAIIVIGWIVAVVVRAVVRKGLGLLRLNQGVTSLAGEKMDLEGAVARGAFWIVLLLAFIAFFNALQLTLVSAPLQSLVDKVLAYVPHLVGGGVLMLVAWLLATLLRKLAVKGLAATQLDDKLTAGAGMRPMSENLGNALYGLVLLLFLPAVLGALSLEGLLAPIQEMLNKILGMLPHILAAVVLGGVGWFVAKLLRGLVTNLLEAAGVNKVGEKAGLSGTMTLSGLIGLIVFVFVFVPALIAALDALKMEAISSPATAMLDSFMSAIPRVFAAGVVLAIAFFVAEFLVGLAAGLLGGIGFDTLPAKLGLGKVFPEGATPSRIVGRMIGFFILLFAVVEAANLLGFTQISDLVAVLIEFGGQVLLGIAIIAAGLWIANLAHGAIGRLGRPQSPLLAELVRFAILGIVLAMGLRAMDLANEIVNAAFMLTLGAVAVAAALSFGLGGREAAGRQLEHWFARLRGEHE